MKLVLASSGIVGGDISANAVDAIRSSQAVVIQSALTPSGKYVFDNFENVVSLDFLYEKSRTYDTLNSNIAKEVLRTAKTQDVVFLVDGSVTENEACAIIRRKRKDAKVLSGCSKADYFASLAGITGEYLAVSAYRIDRKRLSLPLVVYDVDNVLTAGEVKLAVSDCFGDDISISLFHGDEAKNIPLFELDRQADFGSNTGIVVNSLPLTKKTRFDLDDLLEILDVLRSENGCPWDRAQTKDSIKKNTIEEAYELVDAVQKGDESAICEEVGDVLLQVAFQTTFAKERGAFTMRDALSGLCEKLITRHTHVFGYDDADDENSALNVWDKNKCKEKGFESGAEYLSSVPTNFPALMRADKIAKRSGKYNMDFPTADDALKKVYEELGEVKAEIGVDDSKLFEECGDFLFAAASYVRKLGVDSETALSSATDKFLKRFIKTEELVKRDGKDMQTTSVEELDVYYNESKKY